MTSVFRLAATACWAGIGNGGKIISAAAVFGERAVIKIKLARFGIHDHIFENRAPHLRCRKNFGFGLGGEFNHLGIAAAFEVKQSVLAPAMFVIADQCAVWISGEGGLACARKPKEDRRIIIIIDINRAVHWHDALGGEVIIEG